MTAEKIKSLEEKVSTLEDQVARGLDSQTQVNELVSDIQAIKEQARTLDDLLTELVNQVQTMTLNPAGALDRLRQLKELLAVIEKAGTR
jgi:predicted  nucleic acid-binding Zn-ribbon protein